MKKQYVNIMKALGICLVVLGHINTANALIKPWIYGFHMPLFFFIAGTTLKEGRLTGQYIRKKVERLIVPYFLWGLMYAGMSGRSVIWLLYGSYHSIGSAGALTSLWYLPCLFLSLMIAKFLVGNSFAPHRTLVVAGVLIVTAALLPVTGYGYPWCLDVALYGAAFLLTGYLAEKWCQGKGTGLFIAMAVAGAVLSLAYLLNAPTDPTYVLMANRQVGNVGWFLVQSLGGCMMVYGVSRLIALAGETRVDRALSYIGCNSLTILVLHKQVISACTSVLGKGIPAPVVLVSVFVISVALSCAGAFVINRFCPAIVGNQPANG